MDTQEKQILETMDQLLTVLHNFPVQIGVSAMICLLVDNAQDSGIDKNEWFGDLEETWKFYEQNRLREKNESR